MLKNVFTSVISFGALFAMPAVVFGATGFQADGAQFGTFLQNVITFINNVIIPFILGIGFLFFVWGMFLYFIKGGADDDAKESGKSLIIYATAGFVLIFIFWGLVELLTNSTGFKDDSLDRGFIPKAPGSN
ncbi:hypothetical protein K2Q16_04545 [Patescibacteria group bacterium]|nr:hypothetical protein [Patescibacteria group bacterium]